MEVAAAGFEEIEAVGEARVFVDERGVVVAVKDFDARETEVGEVFEDLFELRVVGGAELDGMGEDR